MQLNIKYFGLLAEITGCHEETINFEGSMLNELLDIVFKKYPELEKNDFQLAQNKEIVNRNIKITYNEIALLPPFSGG